MERHTKKIFIALMVLALSGFKLATLNCDKELEEIISFYKKAYTKDKLYMKYSNYSIENNDEGDRLLNELWMSNGKIKFNNEFYTVYQDQMNQVMILKSSKLIVIKKISQAKGSASNSFTDLTQLSPSTYLDSLKKIATKIECTENHSGGKVLTINYPETINKNTNPLESVKMYYTKGDNFKINKTEFIYKSSVKNLVEVYEYLEMSNEVNSKVLEGDALEKVLANGNLKQEFQDYTLRDLR